MRTESRRVLGLTGRRSRFTLFGTLESEHEWRAFSVPNRGTRLVGGLRAEDAIRRLRRHAPAPNCNQRRVVFPRSTVRSRAEVRTESRRVLGLTGRRSRFTLFGTLESEHEWRAFSVPNRGTRLVGGLRAEDAIHRSRGAPLLRTETSVALSFLVPQFGAGLKRVPGFDEYDLSSASRATKPGRVALTSRGFCCVPLARPVPMCEVAREDVFAPDEMAIVHVMNRIVRRCFLLGDDPVTGKNYDHRKVWIEQLRSRHRQDRRSRICMSGDGVKAICFVTR